MLGYRCPEPARTVPSTIKEGPNASRNPRLRRLFKEQIPCVGDINLTYTGTNRNNNQ